MTDDPMDAAVALITEAFDATEVTVIRAKCPRCRRWCIRSRYALTLPCYLCADIGEPFRFWDLLLMQEFRLTWAAYQRRLEQYGPPWLAPREWVHSKARQMEWNRAHGSGRQSVQSD